MFSVLKKWYRDYFSDEEAIYLFLLVTGGLALVVFFGRMLAPLFTALVLAYLMQGGVTMLVRRGMAHLPAVLLVFLVFLGLLVASLVVLLPMTWRQTVALLQDHLPRLLANGEEKLRQLPGKYPELISLEQVDAMTALAREELALLGQSVVTSSIASLYGAVEVMIFLVLVPLLVFFMLKDKDALIGRFVGFLPEKRQLLQRVWSEMDDQLSNYVRGKAVEIVLVGGSSFVAFVLLDLRYAVLLGVLVGLSVIVPYIGATVVTIPVAAVAWVQFGWSGDLALVLLVYGIIQFIDGNILVPLLFSEAVNLHPVSIIAAILLFGGLWGLWGVFFAIPLATLIKAMINSWPGKVERSSGLSVENPD